MAGRRGLDKYIEPDGLERMELVDPVRFPLPSNGSGSGDLWITEEDLNDLEAYIILIMVRGVEMISDRCVASVDCVSDVFP